MDRAGIGCEPASAAAVAGAQRLVREGVIRRGEQVVAVLTGHLLKDPESITRADYPNQPVEIDARLDALELALRA